MAVVNHHGDGVQGRGAQKKDEKDKKQIWSGACILVLDKAKRAVAGSNRFAGTGLKLLSIGALLRTAA